jgi:hypothetical protein
MEISKCVINIICPAPIGNPLGHKPRNLPSSIGPVLNDCSHHAAYADGPQQPWAAFLGGAMSDDTAHDDPFIDEFVRRIAAKSGHIFKDAKSDLAKSTSHPRAIELVAGIAKAGREGRIEAWHTNSRERDFEPVQQPDGSWLTCCPAHEADDEALALSE